MGENRGIPCREFATRATLCEMHHSYSRFRESLRQLGASILT